jgi:hypothetical protein
LVCFKKKNLATLIQVVGQTGQIEWKECSRFFLKCNFEPDFQEVRSSPVLQALPIFVRIVLSEFQNEINFVRIVLSEKQNEINFVRKVRSEKYDTNSNRKYFTHICVHKGDLVSI